MRSEARIIFVAIHVAEYVSSGNLEKSKCQIFSETVMHHEWIMDIYISKKTLYKPWMKNWSQGDISGF